MATATQERALGRGGAPVNRLPTAARLLGIGWYVAFCIVAGTVGGLFIDGATDTRPLFTMLGLFLGLFMAFVGAYALLMEALGVRQPPKRKDG
jgi:hypothetical protein